MKISRIIIENFKCFEGKFSLELNEGLNILVGNNESGKSTILEAIHLALSGFINGKYLKNELTQYLFNNEVSKSYVKELKDGKSPMLPSILIEVHLTGNDLAMFEGDSNSEKKKGCGISLKIAFDNKYQVEYEQLIKSGSIKTIPIEYYELFWTSFARESITSRAIPIKSALIDSANYRYQNGSDIYISRIIKENLDSSEVVDISQAYRKMKEVFMDEEAIKTINTKIGLAAKISDKTVTLSVDLSSRNAWESSLMTYLDEIPFHHIGKGEQCIVKTKLALGHKKSKEANLILMEEPENHLSHTKLNYLINTIRDHCEDKQIIISTHSSFVANKLGLESLILLNNHKTTTLKDLKVDTNKFFKKLAGYDTLRLILCEKAILVEGDSDELIVQKAFRVNNQNILPIEKGIDVISVGTSFLRFLEIANRIDKPTVVVSDNDGDLDAIHDKYKDYLDANQTANIKICFDKTIDSGPLQDQGKPFNYNTLEPKMLKENSLDLFNKIFETEFSDIEAMHKYMKVNKTECALKIFESNTNVIFPEYILASIN